MGAKNAKLHLTPGIVGSSIEVDGHRLTGVHGVTVVANDKSVPKIFVDFVVHEIEVDGELVITVPDRTQNSLIALGWTPPAS